MELIKGEDNSIRFEGDWLNIFEIIELIKWRPGLFIGNRKITTLWDFLKGYEMALRLNKFQEKSFPDFALFSTWIKGRIKSEFDLSAGWYYHLLKFFKDDEEKAFEYFFELIEEFKSSKPVCEMQKIHDNQRCYFHHNQNAIDNYDKAKEILIFKLPPSKSYWCILIDSNGQKLSESFEESRSEILKYVGGNFKISSDWNKLSSEVGLDIVKKLIK
jgi:hypothetical protein